MRSVRNGGCSEDRRPDLSPHAWRFHLTSSIKFRGKHSPALKLPPEDNTLRHGGHLG
jgi:hypothetical protein